MGSLTSRDIETCLAPGPFTHPRTRKSGYCELHHVEYQRAKKRYKDKTYNYQHHRSTTKPPEWKDFLANVTFTRLDITEKPLDYLTRQRLQSIHEKLQRVEQLSENTTRCTSEMLRLITSSRKTLGTVLSAGVHAGQSHSPD